jgi:hypothetical protein
MQGLPAKGCFFSLFILLNGHVQTILAKAGLSNFQVLATTLILAWTYAKLDVHTDWKRPCVSQVLPHGTACGDLTQASQRVFVCRARLPRIYRPPTVCWGHELLSKHTQLIFNSFFSRFHRMLAAKEAQTAHVADFFASAEVCFKMVLLVIFINLFCIQKRHATTGTKRAIVRDRAKACCAR